MRLLFLLLSFSLSLVLSISGCSVTAAATGTPDPEFEKLTQGVSREVVETELGSPVKEKQKPNGSAALYSYTTGDEAAPGRAVAYLVGDIFTLFLAEYIFWPLEIANGNPHDVIVDYNKTGTLVRIRKPTSKDPEAEL